MEVITALREAIGTAHEEMEKKREEVEILESKLDYALKENNPEGCQESKLSSPRKENTMILFDDEDCSITLSDGQVQEIKNALTIITLSGDLLLSQKEGLSAEGKERVEMVKRQVWRIDGILSKKEEDNESRTQT